jgi:hypothetical protein
MFEFWFGVLTRTVHLPLLEAQQNSLLRCRNVYRTAAGQRWFVWRWLCSSGDIQGQHSSLFAEMNIWMYDGSSVMLLKVAAAYCCCCSLISCLACHQMYCLDVWCGVGPTVLPALLQVLRNIHQILQWGAGALTICWQMKSRRIHITCIYSFHHDWLCTTALFHCA